MKKIQIDPDFKPFLRKQQESATCADCNCQCKGKRKGCANFTPTAKFYDSVRDKFNAGIRSQPVPVQSIAELAVSMKSGGLVNKRMEEKTA